MCSVCTAVSKKKNALACVMLAMVVLSVQVGAVRFSLYVFVFLYKSAICTQRYKLALKLKNTHTHTEEMNVAAASFSIYLNGC